MKLAESLLGWYDLEKRELPWRDQAGPYGIWVSEIMAQQTRIETMVPYWERFLDRFPTIEALAQATEESVLQSWEGLGYYSRARNLQKTAREVCARYDGRLPSAPEDLEQLPGIGPYIAGAIASMAYGVPTPAVDGNVLRVISRLFGLREDITTSAARREVTARIYHEIPRDRPGDFNQALMDLGARICIPGKPRCPECPLRVVCVAHIEGVTAELPVRAERAKPQEEWYALAALSFHADWLLRRRPPHGTLANQWELPGVQYDPQQEPFPLLQAVVSAQFGEAIRWESTSALETTHGFTHRTWQLRTFVGIVGEQLELPDGVGWIDLAAPTVTIGLPFRRILMKLTTKQM